MFIRAKVYSPLNLKSSYAFVYGHNNVNSGDYNNSVSNTSNTTTNMAANEFINEVLPKQGRLYSEQTPMPVICKPKILPLKSVTLEKLEQMQKEAQEIVKRQEQEEKMKERLLEQQQAQAEDE